jgi:hypothetical protein
MIAPATTTLFAGVVGLYATTAIASVDSYIMTFSPVTKSAAFTSLAYPEEYEEDPNGKVLVHCVNEPVAYFTTAACITPAAYVVSFVTTAGVADVTAPVVFFAEKITD